MLTRKRQIFLASLGFAIFALLIGFLVTAFTVFDSKEVSTADIQCARSAADATIDAPETLLYSLSKEVVTKKENDLIYLKLYLPFRIFYTEFVVTCYGEQWNRVTRVK